eukprot:Nitzschia sp. Nitz4//scaffold108_size72880//2466//2996//NITZ4_005805-RA/size72880-processed-gene-0.33-mRNA-1//1//CDS//3329532639//6561//frame0
MDWLSTLDRALAAIPRDDHHPRHMEGYVVELNDTTGNTMDYQNLTISPDPASFRTLRHYHSLPKALDETTTTKRIPIAKTIRRSSSQQDMSQVDDAESRDTLFYSRVVNGLLQKQQHFRNDHLRNQSQLHIESLMRTRHELDPVNAFSGNASDDLASYPESYAHDDMDVGIFEMDL